jgi:hypothetical protein
VTVTLKSIEDKYKDEGFANIFKKTKSEMIISALERQFKNNKLSSTIQFYDSIVEEFPKLFHFTPLAEEYKKIADTLSNTFGSKKYSGKYEKYYEKLPNVFKDYKQKDDPKETKELNFLDNFLKNIGDDDEVKFGYYYEITKSNERMEASSNLKGKKVKKMLHVYMYE